MDSHYHGERETYEDPQTCRTVTRVWFQPDQNGFGRWISAREWDIAHEEINRIDERKAAASGTFTYRKKPVEIEAVLFATDDSGELTGKIPRWLVNAIKDGTLYDGADGRPMIKTLEGDHVVSDGDYIIRGVKGELYPCKPDIFRLTYDKV